MKAYDVRLSLNMFCRSAMVNTAGFNSDLFRGTTGHLFIHVDSKCFLRDAEEFFDIKCLQSKYISKWKEWACCGVSIGMRFSRTNISYVIAICRLF